MRRILKGFLFTVFVFTTFFVVGTHAQEDLPTTEQITLFNSSIVLEENTDIQIKEEIHYFFFFSTKGNN